MLGEMDVGKPGELGELAELGELGIPPLKLPPPLATLHGECCAETAPPPPVGSDDEERHCDEAEASLPLKLSDADGAADAGDAGDAGELRVEGYDTRSCVRMRMSVPDSTRGGENAPK